LQFMANQTQKTNPTPMTLVVQGRKAIIRDFKLNLKSILIALLVFFIYVLLSSLLITCVEKSSSFWNWLYFTFINTVTGNVGEVQLTVFGKILTCVNAVVGLISFGIIVVLITLAFQPDSESNSKENPPDISEGTNPESIKKESIQLDQILDFIEDLAKRFPNSFENVTSHGFRHGSKGVNVNIYKHPDGEVHINISFRLNME